MVRTVHKIDCAECDPTRFAGKWVEVYERLNWNEQNILDTAGLRVTADLEGAPGAQTVDVAERLALTLATPIHAWNLTDEDGNDLPADLSGVKLIDAELGDWLLERVEGYYKDRRQTAREKRDRERNRVTVAAPPN